MHDRSAILSFEFRSCRWTHGTNCKGNLARKKRPALRASRMQAFVDGSRWLGHPALTILCTGRDWTMTFWAIAWLCQRDAQILIRGPRHGQITEGAATVFNTQPVQLLPPMSRAKFPPTVDLLPQTIAGCHQCLPALYGNTSRIQLSTYGPA